MRTALKVAAGLLAGLLLVLALNALVAGNEERSAEATVPDGRILELPGGSLQITDSGEPTSEAGQPIVLIHGYSTSLRWFDRVVPLLEDSHRVIRVDLPGHGGSEKPTTGYDIPAQAAVVAQALGELGVRDALVAGHSMGGLVTTSLVEQAPGLVERAVVINMAPSTKGFGPGLPLTARLTHMPLLGPALWRVSPDFVVRDSYRDAFAPGYDLAAGFEDPDQVVADFRAMTYPAFDGAHDAADAYTEQGRIDERLASAGVPLLVIFGAEDQIFDAERSLAAFEEVAGARTLALPGVGHSPNVETPEELARALEEFARPAPVGERAKGRRASGG
jgi:pimeloyl-ACP methyl ester carboxylesterase